MSVVELVRDAYRLTFGEEMPDIDIELFLQNHPVFGPSMLELTEEEKPIYVQAIMVDVLTSLKNGADIEVERQYISPAGAFTMPEFEGVTQPDAEVLQQLYVATMYWGDWPEPSVQKCTPEQLHKMAELVRCVPHGLWSPLVVALAESTDKDVRCQNCNAEEVSEAEHIREEYKNKYGKYPNILAHDLCYVHNDAKKRIGTNVPVDHILHIIHAYIHRNEPEYKAVADIVHACEAGFSFGFCFSPQYLNIAVEVLDMFGYGVDDSVPEEVCRAVAAAIVNETDMWDYVEELDEELEFRDWMASAFHVPSNPLYQLCDKLGSSFVLDYRMYQSIIKTHEFNGLFSGTNAEKQEYVRYNSHALVGMLLSRLYG